MAKKDIKTLDFIKNGFVMNQSHEMLRRSDSLGIPDTSFRGLSTRTARSVRRSKSEPTVARILQAEQRKLSEALLCSAEQSCCARVRVLITKKFVHTVS